MDLAEAFKTALTFEQNGYTLYKKAAEDSKNLLVKKTFSYLAEQELLHIEEIKDFLNQKGVEIVLKGDNYRDVKRFFVHIIKDVAEKAGLSEEDIHAHETALALEKNAHDFYKNLLAEVTDSKIENFLMFLIEQENAHYELIQKAYDYIKDPSGFQVENEGWMFDGA